MPSRSHDEQPTTSTSKSSVDPRPRKASGSTRVLGGVPASGESGRAGSASRLSRRRRYGNDGAQIGHVSPANAAREAGLVLGRLPCKSRGDGDSAFASSRADRRTHDRPVPANRDAAT
jgi:hypothetical protein